ncbi:MAG: hypothetical protein QM820_19645 [Minicystis sp.]
MRSFLLASLLGIAACGGKVVVDVGGSGIGGAGGSGGSSSSTGIIITGPAQCPPHSSPGCCFGDGQCCDCVSSTVCQSNPFQEPLPSTLAFDACACQPDVCGQSCVAACAGQGIDQACQECAKKAAVSACIEQFKACPINGGE